MNINVGHKVKFINENLSGEIKAILSEKKVIVSCSDGFDLEVLISELLIVGEDNEYVYKIDESEFSEKIIDLGNKKEKRNFLSKYTSTNKFKYERTIEVDLHLERLVEFPGKLEDWQRLHTQMQYVKNCLSAAKEKNIRKIVFIHGVGTGVLKTELHNYISNFEDLAIKAGDFREYGAGATEVIIKNS
jgi:hypothetical protein